MSVNEGYHAVNDMEEDEEEEEGEEEDDLTTCHYVRRHVASLTSGRQRISDMTCRQHNEKTTSQRRSSR